MAASRAHAQFLRAVYLLATETGSIQERVGTAWVELLALRREDVPPPLQEAFGAIEAEMLSAPEDPTTLSEQLAAAAADRMVRLAFRLLGE